MKKGILSAGFIILLLGASGAHAQYQMSQNVPNYSQEQIRQMQSSGSDLYYKAMEFMRRAESGQLSPDERRQFQVVEQKANDLMYRLQNGQLTPAERQVFEGAQRMLRNPLGQ